MAEAQRSDANGATSTVVETEENETDTPPNVQSVTLKKPKSKKKVGWSSDTVDNENMNKKKSKCCCIYKKPKKFDESSSEDSDDECDHCQGHVEKKHSSSSEQPENTEENT